MMISDYMAVEPNRRVMMKTKIILSALGGISLALAGSCTTKGYVRKQTEPLVNHINRLDRETAKNMADLKRVNRTTTAGVQQANANSQTALQQAQSAQSQAQRVSRQLDQTGQQIHSLASTLANLNQYTVSKRQVVHFGFNKWNLTADARAKLDRVVGLMQQNPHTIATLKGYTDWTGPATYNLKLSQWRADSVVRYLEGHGIGAYRIFMIGLGKHQYVASNRTLSGREANRRVQVTVLTNSLGQAEQPQATSTPASSGQPQ